MRKNICRNCFNERFDKYKEIYQLKINHIKQFINRPFNLVTQKGGNFDWHRKK